MEATFVKTLRGFEPADDDARRALRRIPVGATVVAQVRMPRNGRFHRKFMAMVGLVFNATGKWPTQDRLLIDLKFRVGHTESVMLGSTGEVVHLPLSIAFHKMDDVAFEAFYERCLRELCEMAGGIESDVLRQTVLQELMT